MGETDIVQIRYKDLANGKKSVYLTYRVNGKRHYEFPKLYLFAEEGKDKRIIAKRNKETMQVVRALQARRILELSENRCEVAKFRRGRVLLRSFIGLLITETSNANTKRRYAALVRLLQGYDQGDTYLDEIDKDYCLGLLKYMSQYKKKDGTALTESTKQVYIQTFKSCLSRAVRNELIEKNPCQYLRREELPCNDTGERVYLDISELRLLEKTEADDKYTKQVFIFCCFTGLRWSDVEDLRWSDIKKVTDISGRMRYRVTRKMIKTKIDVTFYLSDEALRWLPKRDGNIGLVFHDLPSHKAVNSHLRKWVKQAGIDKDVTFHTARHTYATMLLTLGVDLYTVSKLLGHTNVQTTQIYAKIIDQKKEEAADQIDKFFGRKNATPGNADVAHQ